jgi:hypothetical protein
VKGYQHIRALFVGADVGAEQIRGLAQLAPRKASDIADFAPKTGSA